MEPHLWNFITFEHCREKWVKAYLQHLISLTETHCFDIVGKHKEDSHMIILQEILHIFYVRKYRFSLLFSTMFNIGSFSQWDRYHKNAFNHFSLKCPNFMSFWRLRACKMDTSNPVFLSNAEHHELLQLVNFTFFKVQKCLRKCYWASKVSKSWRENFMRNKLWFI